MSAVNKPLKENGLLTFCTRNKNKFREAQQILQNFNIPITHYKISLPEIQDNHISNIALFSAKTALRNYPRPLIVEDTGLYIRTLQDFPGPYAAFVENTIGNPGIIKLMQGISDRSAEFRTAIAFIQPGFSGHAIEGRVTGQITEEIRPGTTNSGWGYDPIFIPSGHNQTYAEMGVENKNRCSHRHKAFLLFGEWYKSYLKSKSD